MITFTRITLLTVSDKILEFAFFSMQDYLTGVWGISFTHAAAILNIWGAISKIVPVFSLFLADARTGYLRMIAISSIPYIVGIALVAISIPPILSKATGTCKEYEARCIGHIQKAVFYTGMSLLAVGIGARQACLKPFLSTQPSMEKTFGSQFNALVYLLMPILAFFSFPYCNKRWVLLFSAVEMYAFGLTVIFFKRWRSYVSSGPNGSPLSDVCRVFVAAAHKIRLPLPADTNRLYNHQEHNSFTPSRFLRCLEKAAIILPDRSIEEQARNGWRLCSVEKVEIAKLVVRFIPMGTIFIMCTVVSSVGNTFFAEQGRHMNRNIGKWKVPSQVLLALFFLTKKFLFDKLADSLIQDHIKYGPPIGIAVAMLFSVLSCVCAAGIEVERLKGVKRPTMSAFWLFFPFFLLAGMESFFRKSVVAFYENESPEDITSYCSHFADLVSGVGLIWTVLLVYVVGKISERGGRQNWFQYTLVKSRLDLYYWVLAGLSALNLLIFIPLACLYRYQNPKTKEEVEEDEYWRRSVL